LSFCDNRAYCYDSPGRVKEVLWSLLYAAMDSDIADEWSKNERTGMLLFYELTTEFVTAVLQIV
jgi:hypothetical protein